MGTNFLWRVRWKQAKTSFGEGDWIVNRMLSSRWPKLYGNKMFERLLPREKFDNMDHDIGW